MLLLRPSPLFSLPLAIPPYLWSYVRLLTSSLPAPLASRLRLSHHVTPVHSTSTRAARAATIRRYGSEIRLGYDTNRRCAPCVARRIPADPLTSVVDDGASDVCRDVRRTCMTDSDVPCVARVPADPHTAADDYDASGTSDDMDTTGQTASIQADRKRLFSFSGSVRLEVPLI
jgi:hypothetical protein